ncbi:hypothetical protein [Erythrobacter alti]|uniref:hypothetical protein n=1 Tax=Erythrobacter alti TaxID=1896145 RepID=UPI0030F44D5A
MHVLTKDNYGEATEAIRDILMMYVDMADAYAGFGHSSDVYVRFDRVKFLDAQDDGKAVYVDLELLRAGSAIAILCFFYNLWCEEHSLSGSHTERYEAAIMQGRLSSFPDIESVVREAISRKYIPLDDNWFEEAVAPIYRNHVLRYFKSLAQRDRTAT